MLNPVEEKAMWKCFAFSAAGIAALSRCATEGSV
jgi:hypothetical protein